MIDATKKYYKNRNYSSGRTSREDFWNAILGATLCGVIVFVVIIILSYQVTSPEIQMENKNMLFAIPSAISSLFLIVNVQASYSLISRRLHDVGLNRAFILLGFIFPIGTIILIVLLCKDSEGDNEYGDMDEQV